MKTNKLLLIALALSLGIHSSPSLAFFDKNNEKINSNHPDSNSIIIINKVEVSCPKKNSSCIIKLCMDGYLYYLFIGSRNSSMRIAGSSISPLTCKMNNSPNK